MVQAGAHGNMFVSNGITQYSWEATDLQYVILVMADSLVEVVLERLTPFIRGTDSLHKSQHIQYSDFFGLTVCVIVSTCDNWDFVVTLQCATDAISYGLPPSPVGERN